MPHILAVLVAVTIAYSGVADQRRDHWRPLYKSVGGAAGGRITGDSGGGGKPEPLNHDGGRAAPDPRRHASAVPRLRRLARLVDGSLDCRAFRGGEMCHVKSRPYGSRNGLAPRVVIIPTIV